MQTANTHLVRVVADGPPQEILIVELEYDQADGLVCCFPVLLEYDLYERIYCATPGLFAVHARTSLRIVFSLVL